MINSIESLRIRIAQAIILIPFVLLWLVFPCLADDTNKETSDVASVPVELTAPIMSVDLDNNLMVVAEKDILLRSTIEDGKKLWITDFVDQNGQSIPASTFKIRDRVKITGMSKGETAVSAEAVRLLSSPGSNKIQPTSTTNKNTTDANGTSPKLVNGVWSN